MAVCVFCGQDDDYVELELAAIPACGHELCSSCMETFTSTGMACPGCNPDDYAPDPDTGSTSDADDGTSSDDEGYVTADDGGDELDDGTGGTGGAEGADEGPDRRPVVAAAVVAQLAGPAEVDLVTAQAAAAARLGAAIDRADLAVTAADAALESLEVGGATAAGLTTFVDGELAGWSGALEGCRGAEAWRSYADGAINWEASEETIAELDSTAAGYETNAAYVEGARALLDSLTVLCIGEGVYDSISATGEANLAAMALGGPGWTGNNLHDLSRDLKGWKSLRAEGGSVLIVRWTDELLEVGATGKHIETSGGYDYKLDQGSPVETFVPHVAWKVGTANKLSATSVD